MTQLRANSLPHGKSGFVAKKLPNPAKMPARTPEAALELVR
jgi:hypothetical protein